MASVLLRSLRFSSLANRQTGRLFSSSAAEEQKIVVDKQENGLWVLRLNRPTKLNSVDDEMYIQITKELRDASDKAKMLVLTGTGDYYSAGTDLSLFKKFMVKDADAVLEARKLAQDTMINFLNAFIDCRVPLVAAVNGPSLGIMCTSLLLCDVILASEKATFLTPFSSTAQSPEGVSSLLFEETLGKSVANQMLLFNRKLTAKEAESRGFVGQIFPNEDFLPKVLTYLDGVLASSSSEAMIASKNELIMNDKRRAVLKERNRLEAEVLGLRHSSPDFWQFLARFSKRK